MKNIIKNNRIKGNYIGELTFFLGWLWFISSILFFLTFHNFYLKVLLFSSVCFFVILLLHRVKEKY